MEPRSRKQCATAAAVVGILLTLPASARPHGPAAVAATPAVAPPIVHPTGVGAALAVGGTWANLLGGAGDDSLAFGRANPDSSVDLVGTFADGGAGERGWIVRLDAAGTPLVQKLLGSDTVRVEEIVATADGGFLVRASLLLPFSDTQTVVAKLNGSFGVAWQKTVGDTLTRYDDLVPLADGGALLSGTLYSSQTFSSSQLLTRVDSSGNLLWRRDLALPGNFTLFAVELADGGFALAGTLRNADNTFDAWICRLSSSGVRQWDARIDAVGDESGLSVAALAGGALVLGGLTSPSGSGSTDVLLVRFDATGAVTTRKALGGTFWDNGTAVVGADGKLYLVGGTMSFGEGGWDGWLSELDPMTLEPLWSRVIGSTADDLLAFLPDSTGGGFFASGTSRAGGGARYNIFAGKLAAGANAFAWQRLIGAGRDEAGAAARLPDASVLVTGSSESFAAAPLAVLPAVPQDDALVVKLDADGELAGCDLVTTPTLVVASFTPTVTTPPLTATAVAPSTTSPAEVTGAVTLSFGNGALTPRNACTAVELLAADAYADTTFGPAPLAVAFTGSAANGQPPYTYSWNFGDGSPASPLMSPSHTYIVEGSYTATLTVTDAAATTATDSVTITVDQSGCSIQCLADVPTSGPAGTPLFLSGGYTAVGCSGQPTYAWDFGDGGAAATKDAQHAYAAAGTFQWSLTVTLDGEQCSTGGSISITGVQEISVLAGGAALVDGQAAAVGFGTVGQGQPGSARSFTVRNDGAAILTLGAVTAPAGFTITEPLVGPLYPGDSDTLTVRLDSAVLGAKSGQLVINSNDPDEQPFNVPLAGSVVTPSSLPRRFDFGTATSPVAAGWLRMSHTTAYGAAQGYGWTSGTIQTRDRAAGGDLNRDLAFSPLATFEVDVAYGVWDVTVTLGDATAAHEQMGVLLEGAGVDEITTRVNEFITRTFRVTVADGRLTLTLDDLGGGDANVVITALALAPPVADGKFDFGTATSPVEPGYTRVEPGTAYSAATGFGWLSGTRDARDRATGGDLFRDFVFSAAATFVVDVPPGVWDVTVSLGDMTTAHEQMAVFYEGDLAVQVSNTPGLGSVAVNRVAVLDGQLTVLLDDLGGADPNVTICGLTIVPADRNRFDFGTASSPVGFGHTRVTDTTAYSPAQKYGWLSGARSARDRGTGTEVTRDFVFTALADFAVDVPAGRYDVTLVLGDATGAHEQMGVYLEGNQVDSITTAVNQFVTRTYRVAVNDGQLLLKLDDLGGKDANVVINALEIVPAAILRLDFGTATSPVAADYVRVTETTAFAAVPGYGWLSGTRQARDRATADPLARDFVFSTLATFAADLPRGSHQVTVHLGDATAAHEQMGVYFEGDLFESVTTAAGQVAVRTTNIDVTDGQLTLLLDDLGGGDPNVVINALEIR